ncbi:MAG: hydantoinase B/oxoprolinase family protein [Syntrophorhabdales bacterium]|jgi:N-methylhydantoinase B/oxoprolinase/acetone carboxylase alpha subunit
METITEKLDAIPYEIFYNRMKQVMEEGKEVLRYLSGSTIAREAGEVMQAFYLPTGEAVMIACGILMHIMNVTRVIKYMNSNDYQAEGIGIYDGDHFLNNDAYIGGMHAPDTGLVAPIFFRGELLGYTASISHTAETGGIEPGGMCPSATEAWHDGLHLPAVKLIEKGRMQRDVLGMILRSVRTPHAMEVDIKARLAANERVRARITELVEDVGIDFFKTACRQLLEDARAQARVKLKALRPGTYVARVYNDTVGVRGDKLAIIQLEVEITEDGELYIRASIVSPQTPSYNNAYFPAVEASAFYILLVQLMYDTRWNSAISDLVHFDILPSSRINADADQSVGYATVGIAQTFTNALTECLSRAFYSSGQKEETVAAHNAVCNEIWGGIDQHGRRCGNVLSNAWPASGMGGRYLRDGIDSSIQYFNPWSYTADSEGEEAFMPVLHWLVKHRANSGGFGKWRGGSGVKVLDIVHGSNNITTYAIGTGGKIQLNQGLFGGYPSACVYTDRIVDTDFVAKAERGERLPYDFHEARELLKGTYIPGTPTIPARLSKEGDILMHPSIGGAGLGDPIERDPELIIRDIRNGHATIDVAQKVYRVSIDPKTLTVDYEKTKALRESKQKERLEKGVAGGEFLGRLVEKRKNRDLPQVAQDFINETAEFCEAFRQALEKEEKASQGSWKPVGRNGKIEEELFDLTMYVGIGRLKDGRIVTYCKECGFVYGDAGDNFKYYCLVYERDPSEILPGAESNDRMSPDKDWCVFREFYCPGCRRQIEVESTPPGTPVVQNYLLSTDRL